MSTFFVTGGSGFIGRAFIRAAELLGHDTINFDQVNGDDVSHGTWLNDSVKRVDPDWIVHLAATPGVGGSMEAAIGQVNDMGNVLRAASLVPKSKILFVSTGSVYGEQDAYPTPVFAPIKPQTGFYSAGKLACEGVLSAWCEKTGGTGVTLRLGTIIGPGNRKGLIFDFVKRLRQNPAELRLIGDGQQKKSYVHIEDLVSAMFASMDAYRGYHVDNVGDGCMSVARVAEIVAEEMGLMPAILADLAKKSRGFGDIGFGDVKTIDLQSNIWGWKIKHTIPGSIKANVRWLLDNPEVFG